MKKPKAIMCLNSLLISKYCSIPPPPPPPPIIIIIII
jgi:hypothetical protein